MIFSFGQAPLFFWPVLPAENGEAHVPGGVKTKSHNRDAMNSFLLPMVSTDIQEKV